jgi:hypothetical protein
MCNGMHFHCLWDSVCPVYLIFYMTPSLPFVTPPNALQIRSLLQLPGFAHPAIHWAICQPSSLLPSFVVLRIRPTFAVQADISFVALMAVFLLTSFESLLLLSLIPGGPLPWESTHFSSFCWMQGWGVLVCPWSSSRAGRS